MKICCSLCDYFVNVADEIRRRNRQGATFWPTHRDHGYIYKCLYHCRRNQTTPSLAEYKNSNAFEGPHIVAFWGEGKVNYAWTRDVNRFTRYMEDGGGKFTYVLFC